MTSLLEESREKGWIDRRQLSSSFSELQLTSHVGTTSWRRASLVASFNVAQDGVIWSLKKQMMGTDREVPHGLVRMPKDGLWGIKDLDHLGLLNPFSHANSILEVFFFKLTY